MWYEYADDKIKEKQCEVMHMMNSFFWGGGFEIMFFLMFCLIFGIFIFVFIKVIGQWNKNNNSPRLTVEATVVAKREDVSHHHHNHANGGMDTTYSTWYYVTFQVESGDRVEFAVNGSEFGMLVEGDYGKLTFQGTRYLGFERI